MAQFAVMVSPTRNARAICVAASYPWQHESNFAAVVVLAIGESLRVLMISVKFKLETTVVLS